MLANLRFETGVVRATLLSGVLWLAAVPGGSASAADLPKEASEAIAAHQATLEKIETAHVKTSSRHRASETAPFETTSEDEWWKSGERNRFVSTVYRSLATHENPKEPRWIVSDPPERHEFGYDDREVRTLEGWNSDDVPTEPVHPVGKYHTAFYRINASIGERDPERPTFGPLSLLLLLSPWPGEPLKELAESASEVRVTASEEEVTLELLGVKMYGGAYDIQATLDRKHGNLIRRLETWSAGPDGTPLATMAITKFADLGDGVYFPLEAASSQNGAVVMETSVTEYAINEPMDADLATVRFPEGCRVHRIVPGAKTIDQSHLWGKGEPRCTFATNAEYEQWHLGVLANGKRE